MLFFLHLYIVYILNVFFFLKNPSYVCTERQQENYEHEPQNGPERCDDDEHRGSRRDMSRALVVCFFIILLVVFLTRTTTNSHHSHHLASRMMTTTNSRARDATQVSNPGYVLFCFFLSFFLLVIVYKYPMCQFTVVWAIGLLTCKKLYTCTCSQY